MQSLGRNLLSMTDLTSLNDADDVQSIRKLLEMASTDGGKVAAVCVFSRFIPVVQPALKGTGIALAVVANFPDGGPDAQAAAAEIEKAIAQGANEIDVVFPYRALMAGDAKSGSALVRACRAACGEQALLKVILETGQLNDEKGIRRAAEIASDEGAHFLKTSTGKTQPGATPEAVGVLLDVIALYGKRGIKVGLKVSGGVRKVEQAREYLQLYEDALGVGTANATNFRLGASSLVKDILTVLR
jgi:deoxyribose-phosphate aldolase